MSSACEPARAESSESLGRVTLVLFGQLLGVLILLEAGRQLVLLLLGLGRYPGSPAVWLPAAALAPICLYFAWGGYCLVRKRRQATFPLLLGLGNCFLWTAFCGLPAWVLTLLLVLMLSAIRWATPADTSRPPRRNWFWLAGAALLLSIAPGCFLFARAQIERAAAQRLRLGNELHAAQRHDEALLVWRRAIEFGYTHSWGPANFNSGWSLQERQEFARAIPYYEILLVSDLDDRTPAAGLMAGYRNYHHRACLELSACHEGLGNRSYAIYYAYLARDQYPFQNWCGTCLRLEARSLARRIQRLETGVEPPEENDDVEEARPEIPEEQ